MPAVLSSWAAGFAARKLIYVPLRAAPERKRVFVSYIFSVVLNTMLNQNLEDR